MSKTIFIQNLSNHDQTFQVHGWNNNQDVTVSGGGTASISAPDGSSGAIIAVHDGAIGEQAEITKCGFGGNDFIDLSNICGAGGNLTVQQKDAPATRKGDPQFMQHLNEAWRNASQDTRNSLGGCVHCNGDTVVRIDAPKDHPELENFVRTFADGKTYIGVGSWNGNAGNANDNAQSSAASGSKDIVVCYNDGDATPSFDSAQPAVTVSSAAAPTPAPAAEEASSFGIESVSSDAGPGVTVVNKSSKECEYFFYDNYWNGNGTAGANFDHPGTSVKLAAGSTAFVSLPATFKGRVQRGTQLPATWVEFQLDAANDHAAHGDISLQQGCDGAATIAAADGSGQQNGFDFDVVSDAPANACRNKPDGEKALDTTVGNWNGGPNQATIDWLNQKVGQQRAYIVGGTGVPDVASKDRRMVVTFY